MNMNMLVAQADELVKYPRSTEWVAGTSKFLKIVDSEYVIAALIMV